MILGDMVDTMNGRAPKHGGDAQPPYGDGNGVARHGDGNGAGRHGEGDAPSRVARWRGTRMAYKALGFLCVGLAAIGVALPVMPTTIFLIVAAWSFARSSESLNLWLHQHRLFGPLLTDWEDHGVIRSPAKVAAIGMIGLSFVIALFSGSPPWVLAPLALVLGAVSLFIVSRPSVPRARAQGDPADVE